MRYLSSHGERRRSGVVLLVVLAMLALFAIVALAFVFYADAEAESAKQTMDGLAPTQAKVDAETLAGFFLSQLLYDTNNLQSAGRGWSMGRGMYGYNPTTLNYVAYNGQPRSVLQYGTAASPPAAGNADPQLVWQVGKTMYGVDNAYNLINYQVFQDPTKPNDNSYNFVRYPEFFGKVYFPPAANPSLPLLPPPVPFGVPDGSQLISPTNPSNPIYGKFRYAGGANPPWTTYDTANLFLAEVDSSGTVLYPSYYRSWHNAQNNSITGAPPPTAPSLPVQQQNVNKYTQLFPDATWNPAFYPLPDADPVTGLQVRNIESGPGYLGKPIVGTQGVGGAPGGPNDSLWMDFGFPVMTAPDGTRYKALIAPLIMDISNRLHMWVHGNHLGGTAANPTHVSNEGIGQPEVNLSLLPRAQATGELQAFFNAKYGAVNGTGIGMPSQFTNLPGLPAQYRKGPWYAPYDGNGLDPKTKLSTAVSTLPKIGTINNFPTYSNGYGNLNDVAGQNELLNSPLALNPYNPGGTNLRMLPPSHFEPIARYGGTNSPAATSLITQTMPTTFSDVQMSGNVVAGKTNITGLATTATLAVGMPIVGAGISQGTTITAIAGPKSVTMSQAAAATQAGEPLTFIGARHLITLSSFGLDRPMAPPVITYTDPTSGGYTFNPFLQPTLRFPYWKTALSANAPNFNNATPMTVVPAKDAPIGDFGADWRSTLGNNLRVDLNRPLTEYATNASQAILDRQNFARDIYFALLQATVGAPVTQATANNFATGNAPFTPATISGARWLAQLAVNLVDYIDDDNNITPFHYNTSDATGNGWVYGTELPGLVLNEVYASNDNDPTDSNITKGYAAKAKVAPTASKTILNVWAELLNPFDNHATPAGTPASLVRNTTNLTNGKQPVYQVLVYPSSADLSTWLRNPANNSVVPLPTANIPSPTQGPPAAPIMTVSEWNPTSVASQGFYVLGPDAKFLNLPANKNFPNIPAMNLNPNLPFTYLPPAPNPLSKQVPGNISAVTVVLQRLACPTLPHNANTASPTYNPFLDVDYIDNVPTMNAKAFSTTGYVGIPAFNTFHSYGRMQPYTGFNARPLMDDVVAAVPAAAAGAGATSAPAPGSNIYNSHEWGVVSQVIPQVTQNGSVGSPQNTFLGKNTQVTFQVAGVPTATYPPTVGNGGFNFFPGVTLPAAMAAPAAAQSVMSIQFSPIITNSGSGYKAIPTVTFSGGGVPPGGSHATATATIAGGKVTAIHVITGGTYTSVPTITISAPTGTPAVQATAAVGNPGATNSNLALNISNATWNAGVVTVTLANNVVNTIPFVVGQEVTIAGVALPGFDGNFTVSGTTGPNSFSYGVKKNPNPKNLPVNTGTATVALPMFSLVTAHLTNGGANNYAGGTAAVTFTTAGTPAKNFTPLVASSLIPAGGWTANNLVNMLAETPYDWLTHLDRPPINSLELLYASGYKPHELTQQFKTPTQALLAPNAKVFTATVNGTTGVITTYGQHGFIAGQTVYISGVGKGFDGAQTVTALGTPPKNTNPLYSFQITVPGGTATGTQGIVSPGSATSTTVVVKGTTTTTVTLQTTGPHGFNTGDWVVVQDVAVPPGTVPVAGASAASGYNGIFQITVPAAKPPAQATTFTYTTNTLDPSAQNLAPSGNGVVYKFQATNKFQHVAPWNPYVQLGNTATMTNMQNTLLYRALETMSTSSHLAGEIPGGRRIGQINPNTIMDQIVFNALCDAQAGQLANQADVDAAWKGIMAARGFGISATSAPSAVPAQEPTPIQPFGSGDVTKTWLQNVTPTKTAKVSTTLFNVSGGATSTAGGSGFAHPYQQGSLLQKVFNNMTTTSNTFAVWFTVGYFQVVDESVQPPRLGQEIGRSQNRNIRQRFFAIVDRSAMELQRKAITNAVPVAASKNASGQFNQFTLTLTNPLNGVTQPWLLQPPVPTASNPNPGIPVEIMSAGPNSVPLGTAIITTGTPGGATAGTGSVVVTLSTFATNFTTAMNAAAAPSAAAPWFVVLRGNPGPQDGNALPFTTTAKKAVGAGANVTMNLTAVQGKLSNGQPWTILPGMLLQVSPRNGVGASEVIFVKSVAAKGAAITADFTLNHAAGAVAMPWLHPTYNPHLDPAVLYLSAIK